MVAGTHGQMPSLVFYLFLTQNFVSKFWYRDKIYAWCDTVCVLLVAAAVKLKANLGHLSSTGTDYALEF